MKETLEQRLQREARERFNDDTAGEVGFYAETINKIITHTLKEAAEEIRRKNTEVLDGLIEQLADIEHKRWSDWQAYLHSRLYEIDDSRVSYNNHLKILPTELYQRWERQIATPYSNLSEAEKEIDREQVRPYLNVIKAALTDLIASLTPNPDTPTT
jgi:predicted house-cleaning noncanonical NTP pyrophosphatase (MazG superfamily)